MTATKHAPTEAPQSRPVGFPGRVVAPIGLQAASMGGAGAQAVYFHLRPEGFDLPLGTQGYPPGLKFITRFDLAALRALETEPVVDLAITRPAVYTPGQPRVAYALSMRDEFETTIDVWPSSDHVQFLHDWLRAGGAAS